MSLAGGAGGGPVHRPTLEQEGQVVAVWGFIWIAIIVLFFVWAANRTRGRGNRDSSGAGDHPTGKYY